MKRALGFFIMGIFLSGCANVSGNCLKSQESIVKAYFPATEASKGELRKDLRSGKVIIGQDLDYIKSHYGDPEDILVADCVIRIIYRPSGSKAIALWFDDGKYLSMWSD